MNSSTGGNFGAPPPASGIDEPLLMDLLRHAGVIFFTVDSDGMVRSANEAFFTTLGYARTAVESGLPLAEVVAPERRQMCERTFQRLLEQPSIEEVETVLLTADRRRVPVRGDVDCRQATDGELVVSALFRDLTTERAAVDRGSEMEERFRLVADGLREGIAILDRHGVIQYLNRSGEAILGVLLDEVTGYDLRDVRWEIESRDGTPLEREDHPAIVAIRTGEPQPERVLGVRAPSIPERRWVAVSSTPMIRRESGAVFGSVSSFRDVTAHLEAEAALRESERRFATLTSQAPVGIFHTGPDGGCLFVNEAWCDLTGLTSEEALGDGWAKALHPQDRERVSEEWARAARERTLFRSEYRFQRPDGSSVWVMGDATPIEDDEGRISGFLGSCTDITHRKELERRKDEMNALVSHELRGPLASVRTSLSLLLGHLDDADDEAAEYHAVATRGTDFLLQLTNDLLDVEKLEAGRAELTIVDVPLLAACRAAEELIAEAARSRDVTIRCSLGESTVRVDRNRLVQVFTNLLTNAVRFAPPGSEVRVEARDEGEFVRVSVRDEGPGIPDDALETVFERWTQIHPADAHSGGAGLGLPICRALVNAMGGRIWAESAEGRGSTFHVCLPRA